MKKDSNKCNFLIQYGLRVRSFGFTQVPNILFREQKALGLTNPELILLVHFISYDLNLEHFSYPSLKQISRKTGMASKTIHRAKRGLIRKGFIVPLKSKNGYGTKIYSLIPLKEKLDQFAENIIVNKWIDDSRSYTTEEANYLLKDKTLKNSIELLGKGVP